MDKDPLVSVVVPTHNRPEFLRKTLESILAQTYRHMEIFVISNGVNSKNQEVVESLNDSRLVYKDQKNSGGPSSPRNHGISLARGKYVAFCDDDDLWRANKIELQIKALEENNAFDLCYGKMMRFDENHVWSISHEEGSSTFNSLLYVNTVPISSLVVRKKMLHMWGTFLEDSCVGAAEDYEFLLRYAAVCKLYFINDYLIDYWSGGGRTTTFDGESKKMWSYYKNIIYIFYRVKRLHRLRFSRFMKPALYHLALVLKILIHQKLCVCRSLFAKYR